MALLSIAGLASLGTGPAPAANPAPAGKPATSRSDGPSVPADTAALLGVLRGSRDMGQQLALIDALGLRGGTLTAAVRGEAAALLLTIIRSDADWSVRGDALKTLSRIDAPDDVVGPAIAAGQSATGEHAGYLRGLALELQAWNDTRAHDAGTAPQSEPEAQRRAHLSLHQHNIEVSYDALTDALTKGQPDIVAELLTAGLSITGADAARTNMAILNGLTSACSGTETGAAMPSAGLTRALVLLAGHGLALDFTDDSGNTLLMSAAQYCPAPITAALLGLGVAVDPVNKQRFTPLQMAFVSGKWDVATLLVDHGARVTQEQAKQIFFEPPQEAAQRAILERATR